MWKKISANTVYQLLGKGISVLASVVAVSLITRSLGTEGFGNFVLATTIPALFYLFVDFGLNAIYLRRAGDEEDPKEKFGNLLVIRGVLVFLFIFVGVSYTFLAPYSQMVKVAILLGLVTVLSQGLFTSFNALYQYHLRYELPLIATAFSSLLSLGLVVLGFLNNLDLIYFVLAWVLRSVVLGGLALGLSFALAGKLKLSFDRRWAKTLFVGALPLGLMLMFSQINARADVFLLSLLDTPESLGIYGLADKVFENILFVPLFFANSLYPVMLEDRRRSASSLWRRLKTGVLILLASSLGLSILGFVFAPFVVFVLGGEGFSSSIEVLRVLVWGLPLFFVTAPIQWFFIVVGKEKILPLIYALAALLNIGLNALLIPRFSYFGSVVGTLSSEFLILVLIGGALWRFKTSHPNLQENNYSSSSG